MKKYIVAFSSLLLLVFNACGKNAPNAHWQKPSRLDSLLNLRYDEAKYQSTLKELAKLDKYQSQQIDSAITFLNTLPNSWAMTYSYKGRMPFLQYRQLNSYANMVEQEFLLYRKIDDSFPAIIEDNLEMPVMKKPVIYLYPTAEQKINVCLGFNSNELYTWPQVNDKLTWTVTAQPDGMLKDNAGEEYPYLFWEGKAGSYYWIDRSEGFVVQAEETEKFLLDKLKVLGLNSRERTDFITYWAPQLHKNKYNFIRFETSAYTTALPLTISPTPESMQRIMMVFEPLESLVKIKEQTLQPFTRKGYTVIEWGGMEMPEIIN